MNTNNTLYYYAPTASQGTVYKISNKLPICWNPDLRPVFVYLIYITNIYFKSKFERTLQNAIFGKKWGVPNRKTILRIFYYCNTNNQVQKLSIKYNYTPKSWIKLPLPFQDLRNKITEYNNFAYVTNLITDFITKIKA